MFWYFSSMWRFWLTLDFKLDVHGDISRVPAKRTVKRNKNKTKRKYNLQLKKRKNNMLFNPKKTQINGTNRKRNIR